MDTYFAFINAICLFMMLFWRKNNITIITFLYVFFVALLVTLAAQYNNFLISLAPDGNTIQSFLDNKELLKNEWETMEFYIMSQTVQFFLLSLFIIWLYQWSFIGKERERIFASNNTF